jgi:hypothetical protein
VADFVEDKQRRPIPAWRQHRETAKLGELRPVEAIVQSDIDDRPLFDEKLREWRTRKTLTAAAELLGAAVVLNHRSEVQDAAEFVLRHRDALQSVKDLALELLGRESPPVSTTPINQTRLLRHRLNDDLNNPLIWVDLAREYAVVGKTREAERAMRTAIGLAPQNRFVIRSASRLFVHLGDPAYAHHLVLRAEATGYDPWLTASEIALAAVAKQPSEFAKTGQRVLRSQRFSPSQTSELASALATAELEHGNNRGSRKLFRESGAMGAKRCWPGSSNRSPATGQSV